MATATKFGRSLFGRELFGFGDVLPAPSVDGLVRPKYTLELYDSTFNLLFTLPKWGSGQYIETVNEPQQLVFTYPLSDERVASFAYPNVVALRDENGAPIAHFHISKKSRKRNSAGGSICVVNCVDVLSQLGRDQFQSYEVTTTTVDDIVSFLFSTYQDNAKVIALQKGAFDKAIGKVEIDFKQQSGSILQALRRIQKIVGGFFYVTVSDTAPYRTLRWTSKIGLNTGQEITLNKNMPSLEIEEDYNALATRIVAKGTRTGSNTWLTSTKSKNTSTFGIIENTISAPNAQTQDELDDIAQETVNKTSVPYKAIRVGAIDLSKAETGALDYSHKAISIGSKVTIVDEELGEILATRYVKITRELASPIHVKIEVDDLDTTKNLVQRNRDVVDVIADLLEDTKNAEVEDDGTIEAAVDEAVVESIAEIETLLGADITDIALLTEPFAITTVQMADIPSVNLMNGTLGPFGAELSDDVNDISEVNVATNIIGTDSKAAPADHAHKGMKHAATFATLPAIPTDGLTFIIHDSNVWLSWPGETQWYPVPKLTQTSGTP